MKSPPAHIHAMDDPLVYLNGAMMPLSEARISVLDRGFIFGDGIYEVTPVYRRRLFRPKQHLARFMRGMRAIELQNPYDEAGWLGLMQQVVDAAPSEDQLLYMQITRGVARRTHAFPAQTPAPTVFLMSNPLIPAPPSVHEQGVACVTMEDKRWLRCEIKSISLLGNVLAAQNAAEQDANETIQFRDGYLTEGSASNVWIVKDGTLISPPRDNLILEGIRYSLMEALCAEEGIPFAARRIARNEVFHADEVLLTSAAREVMPVVTIDSERVGNGKPGPIYKKLYAAYQRAKVA